MPQERSFRLYRIYDRSTAERNPLYDPRRDGCPHPISLTAQVCGDPQPGRREMVAASLPQDRDRSRDNEDWRQLVAVLKRMRERSSPQPDAPPLGHNRIELTE